MAQANWTREELILALNLYCKIPFGAIHIRNPQIIALAKLLHRTASAVSWKLANLARLDPSLQERKIAGASHGSKLDIQVWDEFVNDWPRLAYQSERLLAKRQGRKIEDTAGIETGGLPRAGRERQALVKQRVNQSFFRKAVLAAYNGSCCITGLNIPQLLVASHIVPWSKDETNRVNPCNGLCLNALHDRAFDAGILTITTDYHVKVSTAAVEAVKDSRGKALLARFDGKKVILPVRFLPDPDFLGYHNRHVFKGP